MGVSITEESHPLLKPLQAVLWLAGFAAVAVILASSAWCLWRYGSSVFLGPHQDWLELALADPLAALLATGPWRNPQLVPQGLLLADLWLGGRQGFSWLAGAVLLVLNGLLFLALLRRDSRLTRGDGLVAALLTLALLVWLGNGGLWWIHELLRSQLAVAGSLLSVLALRPLVEEAGFRERLPRQLALATLALAVACLSHAAGLVVAVAVSIGLLLCRARVVLQVVPLLALGAALVAGTAGSPLASFARTPAIALGLQWPIPGGLPAGLAWPAGLLLLAGLGWRFVLGFSAGRWQEAFAPLVLVLTGLLAALATGLGVGLRGSWEVLAAAGTVWLLASSPLSRQARQRWLRPVLLLGLVGLLPLQWQALDSLRQLDGESREATLRRVLGAPGDGLPASAPRPVLAAAMQVAGIGMFGAAHLKRMGSDIASLQADFSQLRLLQPAGEIGLRSHGEWSQLSVAVKRLDAAVRWVAVSDSAGRILGFAVPGYAHGKRVSGIVDNGGKQPLRLYALEN
ncbi:MAG: hypothetical protein LJE84_08880 [Gammaproteobacteria bacterium]|jgi:hypothetical protein|nr:hypothetical protein [Gammaproteobacteria bacterium]